MKIQPATDQASIVLVGAFNPKIFHPAWFALKKLISSEQADDAMVTIVHMDISQFTAAYMAFEIQTHRFQVKCDSIYKDAIKDIVQATFGEHLPHSPVWRLGINRSVSFSCGSEGVRDKFGTLLAPRSPWGSWGAEIEQSVTDTGKHGGMVRLVMLQQPRPDGLKGHIRADLRPVSDDTSVVLVDINNEFVVGDPEVTIGCLDAMDVLRDQWQASLESAEHIVDGLMETVEGLQ